LKISFNEKQFKDLLTILNDLKRLNVINETFPISLEKINELEKILIDIYNKYGSDN
jgi:uncharacterized protein YutE (UPF0331/DUF86 family)